jgi:DNA helicase-2/ATP-dependent DNA helicase PcrA
VPQRFYVTQQAAYGDRHVYASISRFLPESLRHRFEHVAASAPVGAVVASPLAAAVSSDLGARLRSNWR